MKRRNFIKMLPVGFLAARFGGVLDLIKPKKPYSLSAEVMRASNEYSRLMLKAFEPEMEKMFNEFVKEEGLQKVFSTPMNDDYVKCRWKSINIVRP